MLLASLLIALGFIVGGILLLKQSAKKFHLTPEQKLRVEQRKKQQEAQDKNKQK